MNLGILVYVYTHMQNMKVDKFVILTQLGILQLPNWSPNNQKVPYLFLVGGLSLSHIN